MNQPRLLVKPIKKTDAKTAKLLEDFINYMWDEMPQDFKHRLHRLALLEAMGVDINKEKQQLLENYQNSLSK